MNSQAMKIMVVEDNPGDARLVQEALDRYGEEKFNLVREATLHNAVRDLSEGEIDAILLDLTLPDASGLETLVQLQKADSITPIIVLTSLDDEDIAMQALRLGAQDYLVKGNVNGEKLIRALRYSVERNRHGLIRKLEPLEEKLHLSLGALEKLDPKKPGEKTPWDAGKIIQNSLVDVNCLDLAEIIENEKVEAHFQPWVSLKEKSIVGFEGLCRGVESLTGGLLSPVTLLKLAGRRKLLDSLDRLFHKKVLEGFHPAAQWDSEMVLSLNFSPSLLNDDETALDNFVSMVRDNGLDPSRIVIEVLESQVLDLGRLKRFCNLQRSLGFLIALDDIGSGYSNLDRISELKPDLIKTDRSLLLDIDHNRHKREVFKSIVELTHSLGAQVVAEGAETESETMLALELGADMIQGYYFSRPAEMSSGLLASCEEKIEEASRKFKSHIVQNLNARKSQYRIYDRIASVMAGELATTTPKAYDAKLFEMLERHPEAECLFILDEAGTQMSRMASRGSPAPRKHMFFKATARGADHSLKDYFYCLIKSDQKDYTYVTAPYVSPVTGNFCVTVSTLFNNGYGRTNVLCVDVNPDSIAV